ncbi:Phosphatidylinositide phosphatase SAC1, partial [Fragariocoptes setiger]
MALSSREALQKHLKAMLPAADLEGALGLVGIIRLLSGPYLIVITKASPVGRITVGDQGHIIHRVDRFEVVPFSRSMLHLTENQIDINQRYLSMVDAVLKTPHFYYSYTYNLTRTVQHQIQGQAKPDLHFIWNGHLLKEFETKTYRHLDRFGLKLILGYISINQIQLNGHKVNWVLISRRNVKRAGTRFNTRGCDYEGNVSNYVETEQIVGAEDKLASLVQVRGSIPLVWNQSATLEYKPKPVLDQTCDQTIPMKKHFDELSSLYGSISIVNLIDHSGHEGHLEQVFSDKVRYLSSNYYPILYHSFDFHRECSKMRWYRLEILMHQIEEELALYNYFSMTNNVVTSTQKGIMRTNCIDSLDRTNVVQSMIAKLVLGKQLAQFGVIVSQDHLDELVEFMHVFKSTWANHADDISIQYAGTPALKTDFTRTGKRTHLGALRDGINSLTRYYKNNFTDGFRQDSIDLFLGNYAIDPNEGLGKTSPLQRPKTLKQLFLPPFFLGAISLFFFFMLTSKQNGASQIFFFGTLLAFSLFLVFKNGTELVDNPKLHHVKRR